MGSYHPYYLLEAVIFTLVGLTYFVLYAFQIRSERIFSDKMGRVHRTFHYGGFAMSVTLIVSGLDPQGVLGILPWQAVLLVKDLFTCIAYICLALWTVQLVLIISEASGQTSKTTTFLYKNYVETALVSAGVNLIVCLACDMVAITKNNTGPRGFFLVYLGFSFLLAAALMSYCIVDYVKTHKKVTQNSGGRANSSSGGSGEGTRSSSACCGSRWCAKETTKLRNTILAFTFIGLFQLQGGLSILANPIQLSTEQVPVDTQNVHVFVWILPFWVGIGIGLYASWLPIGCVSSHKNSKHSVDHVQSASKPKDSMEVVSAQPRSPTAHQAEV